MHPRVLLIDDDPNLIRLVEHQLGLANFDVSSATTGAEALRNFESESPDAIVLDLQLPDMPGKELLRRFHVEAPQAPVVVLTAQTDLDQVVECMRLGALDYVQKPFDETRLITSVRNACKQGALLSRLEKLTQELRQGEGFDSILGRSAATRRSIELFGRAAQSGVTVLLQGGSGTGKEVAARAIHAESSRRSAAFVPINCGAIPEGLIEAELFGHEKGAYTGADTARAGCFERAEGGTIFLDEIGELRIDLQVRLLRVLQERVVQRIGSARLQPVDVRVIAATNTNLKAAVAAGTLREDLYYRLAVFPIELPALKDREGDITLLAESFVQRFAAQHGKPIEGLSKEARSALESYDWPGNVRELENVLERAIILEDGGQVSVTSLPEDIAQGYASAMSGVVPGGGCADRVPDFTRATAGPGRPGAGARGSGKSELRPEDIVPLAELEKRIIRQALEITGWNVQETASRLGLGRATVYRKMDRFGLKPNR